MLKKFGGLTIYILLCLITFFLITVSNWLLITDDVYYDAFGDQLSFEHINKLIDLNKKWSWVIYPITPILYLLKFFLVVICLSSGAFLFRIEVTIKSLFKIVVVAEFIFLVPSIIKLLWFTLVNTNYTLTDLQYFSPLSALSLFNHEELQPWLVYPLSLVNVFEVAYVLVLSYLFAKTVKVDFDQSLKLVVCSYGAGMAVWVIFVMFLTVSLTPA